MRSSSSEPETAAIVPGRPPAPGQDYDAAVGGAAGSLGAAFADNLAAALAAFTQANTSGPRALPPALLRQRAAAHDDMLVLIEELREKGDVPLYELRAEFFCDDVLVREGARIRYAEIPNESMEPKNEAARQVMALYMRSIGGRTRDLAEESYEAYLRRPRVAQIVGEEIAVSPLGRPGTREAARVSVVEEENAMGSLAQARHLGPRREFGTAPVERPDKM